MSEPVEPYDDSEISGMKSQPFLAEDPVTMFWRFDARICEDRRKLALATEALEFYADEENYTTERDEKSDGSIVGYREIEEDRGKEARKALAALTATTPKQNA